MNIGGPAIVKGGYSVAIVHCLRGLSSPPCYIPKFREHYPTVYAVSPEGSVSVTPLNVVLNRGDNVTLYCSAQGELDNTYQWQRSGTDLDNETMETLTIIQISAMDGGEYTCVVSNAAGNDSASTLLNVSPEIVLGPTDVSARNGTVHMLVCEAEAFPEPQYQWIGNFSENVVGVDGSMLMFTPVLFGDEGEYYCVATSNGHSVESSTSVLTGTFTSIFYTIVCLSRDTLN